MKSLSLALSGGGLLGAAHLGALRFLEDHEVRATAVAGTSAGGLVASLYALEVDLERLIAFGQKVCNHPRDYFSLNIHGMVDEWLPFLGPPATGLIDPTRFVEALLALVPGATHITDWKIPAVVTSVDLVSLETVAFTNRPESVHPARGRWRLVPQSPLPVAMQATMAMPGLFRAPRDGGALLADGGVGDTLPVDWAFALDAHRVVGIDVATPAPVTADRMGLLDVLSRAESYATQTLSRLRDGPAPHVTVRPDTAGFPFFDLAAYEHLVEAGYKAMQNAWPLLQEALSEPASRGERR